MKPKQILEIIETRDEFLDWKTKNPSSYLVHIFKMMDEANKDEIQIGLYDPDKRMITTFVYNNAKETLTINPESEVFKENNEKIAKLDLKSVLFEYDSAMDEVDSIRAKKYKQHLADKSFFILQKLNDKTIWNFTIITKTFHVLNIKIDAKDGTVVEDKLSSIFEFKGKDVK